MSDIGSALDKRHVVGNEESYWEGSRIHLGRESCSEPRKVLAEAQIGVLPSPRDHGRYTNRGLDVRPQSRPQPIYVPIASRFLSTLPRSGSSRRDLPIAAELYVFSHVPKDIRNSRGAL